MISFGWSRTTATITCLTFHMKITARDRPHSRLPHEKESKGCSQPRRGCPILPVIPKENKFDCPCFHEYIKSKQ